MAETVTSLQAKLDQLKTTALAEKAEADTIIEGKNARIVELEAQVAALQSDAAVSQAELDSLGAKIDSAETAVKAVVTPAGSL
jgi:multidrug resistance efflux pump